MTHTPPSKSAPLWRVLAILAALLAPLPAAAAPAAHPAPPPPLTGLTPAEAKQALQVLNDPKKRAEFAALLEALAHAPPAKSEDKGKPAAGTPATASTTAKPALPLAPNSLGAQVLVGASSFADRLGKQGLAALHSIRSIPLLWGWVVMMATDSWARTMLLASAWRLGLVLGLGIGLEYGLRWMLRDACNALEARAPSPPRRRREDPANDTAEDIAEDIAPGGPPASAEARAEHGEVEPPPPAHRRRPTSWVLLRRMPLVFARLVLDIIPLLAMLAVGHLFAASPLAGDSQTQLVILAGVDAYALSVAILAVARMMLSPHTPRLRLVPLSDAQAMYAMRWLRRMVVVTVFGYAIAEVGSLFGLSDSAHLAVMKAVALFDNVALAIIVLQKRRVVRNWIRGKQEPNTVWTMLRRRLGAIWHWIALFYLAAMWLVWAVELRDGFTRMLRFFVITSLVLLLARLLQIALSGVLERTLHVDPAVSAHHPGLEARIAAYHPVLQAALRVGVVVLTLIVLMQAWGLDPLSWFMATGLGLPLISGIASLVCTIVIALLVWEGANIVAEHHLARLTRDAQVTRSARLRTLLPLLRTGLMVGIVVVAGLIVLSEIGLNIAPLLAGAGIIGVAIGFGSQKLVQDLITGIFLLLENAMQVGDFVTVSGLGGTVEALSVRTIRLRASDGSVHIIPFSSVTSVTNNNRGLGNAAVSVTIDYTENTDRVCETLGEIIAEMRADEAFSDRILGDLSLWGVDKVDGAAVTILGQIPCTAGGRWAVQREFNRRLKLRCQKEGIALYNPASQSIAVSSMPAGAAPIEETKHEAAPPPSEPAPMKDAG